MSYISQKKQLNDLIPENGVCVPQSLLALWNPLNPNSKVLVPVHSKIVGPNSSKRSEDFQESSQNKKRSSIKLQRSYGHFMDFPAVIFIGILINPVFGMTSFIARRFANDTNKMADRSKRNRWRQVGNVLFCAGIVVSIGLWSTVFAYHYKQFLVTALEERTEKFTSINVSFWSWSSTRRPLQTSTTTADRTSSPEKPLDSLPTALTHTAPSTEPIETRKGISFDQFLFQISIFEDDVSIKGIPEQQSRKRFQLLT